eukprot:gene3498-2449_t
MVIGPYDLALDVFGFRYLCVYLAGCFESLICIYVTYARTSVGLIFRFTYAHRVCWVFGLWLVYTMKLPDYVFNDL